MGQFYRIQAKSRSTSTSRRATNKARYRKLRPVARATAWAREAGRCIWPTCRRVVALETDDPYQLANGHELTPRSRGGDPCDADQVVIVCWTCHMAIGTPVGGKKKRIEGTRVSEGLRFFDRVGDEWVEVR